MKFNKTSLLLGLFFLVLATLAFFLWKVIAYIIIAGVISLILNPINLLLKKIHIKNKTIPASLRAAFLLLFFWFTIFAIFYFIFPILIKEIYKLASINPEVLNAKISAPIESIRKFFYSLGLLTSKHSNISTIIAEKILNVFNITSIQNLFANIFSFTIELVVSVFVITFISFFFLKDDKLFYRTILLFVPVSYQTEVKHVLICISNMLMKYFSGVVTDMIIIFILVSTGMLIVGCDFNTSITLGIVSALFNVVPYVGPIISFTFGMLTCFLTNIDYDLSTYILPKMLYMAIVYLSVNILDASLIQPYVYSNAIKAHPLEIFLIIISAGLLAGIIGMMLAIPSYMALRIIAKEFFYQFYFVKNITKNLDE